MPFAAWSALLAALTLLVMIALRPDPLPEDLFDQLTGDRSRGRLVFAASGCSSCHSAPEAKPGSAPVLSGGRGFKSPFGTFYAPNVSPGPSGLGFWTDVEIADAILNGVGRGSTHLYPAFPYTAYTHMSQQDAVDLIAYLRTLPPSPAANKSHDIGFPFNIRLGVGAWKLLYLREGWVLDNATSPELERGRYLVEALGHCGECHTPRNFLGALDTSRWLGGAPNPAGEGTIPNITSGGLAWSEDEITTFLKTGFTPTFDSAGGEMVKVIAGLSQLPQSDLEAIAAYLKAVPPID